MMNTMQASVADDLEALQKLGDARIKALIGEADKN
jgi:hypothetical protein